MYNISGKLIQYLAGIKCIKYEAGASAIQVTVANLLNASITWSYRSNAMKELK
jgi:hypothetical protein